MRILITFFFIFIGMLVHSQVGIGTLNPSDAAMLEVASATEGSSTYRGLMPPRVPSDLERDAINTESADIGLLIFVLSSADSNNNPSLQIWNGNNWEIIKELVPLPGTIVEFTNTTATASESSGPIAFDFMIANPSPTEDITVEISADDYTDLLESAPQTFIIPAGATTHTVNNLFNIEDDAFNEGDEDVLFTISSVSGGQGAISIGSNSFQNFTILDNDLNVWINEFHYDNAGGDVNEFVEIAGVAGTDLTGYSLVFYNGGNGNMYSTQTLSGAIDDEGDGYGALFYAEAGIQNGSPDGIALIDAIGNVLQFLSYEGSFTANNGPANGIDSVDVGLEENGSAIGDSLQLTGGPGMSYADFSWTGPTAESPGSLNTGQTFN